jgi:hypothetical protein
MKKSQPSSPWNLLSRVFVIVAFGAVAVAIPYFGVDAGGSDRSAKLSDAKTGSSREAKIDPEAVAVLERAVESGNFELMSSAKQMQLQLKAGMRYEEGVLKSGVPNDVRPYLDLVGYREVTKISSADIIMTAIANSAVNNPALDITGSQKTQSETAIIRGSGNNLVSAYNDSGAFGGSGGGNVFTGYSTSSDNGATWTDRAFIPAGAIGHFGDPVLARNNTTGVIFQATLSAATNGMNIYRSTDEGVTWSLPVNGSPGLAADDGDKEWLAVDNFAGTGNGNVYHGYRDFAASGAGVRFTRSTDNGLTFGPSPGILIASQGQGAFVMVGADHAVYYVWLDSVGGQTVKVRKSTDQGLTFGAAVNVGPALATTATNGGLAIPAGYRSNGFPSCVTHPVNANLLFCAVNDIAVPDRGDIFMYKSTDGGATWAARVRVNSDTGTNVQAFPAMAIRPDGTALSIAWYDNRSDAANRKFQRFATVGTISGTTVTFGPNFVIGDASSTPVFGADSVVNSVYMGDYDQMDASNTNFYSSHVDTRAGTQDVRSSVYTAAGPGPVVSFSGTNVADLAVAANTCTPFNVTVANNGSESASNVMVTLSTATPGVTVLSATQNYGTIAAGATATNPSPFQLDVANNFACGTKITLNVAASTGDNSSFDITTQGVGFQVTTTTGQTLNGGTTDVGNHGDDTVTSGVPLPFPFSFNGTNRTNINLSSNGNAQFTSTSTAFTNVCPLPTATMNNLIAAHWDDLRTDANTMCSVYPGGTCGIFTSTTGSAPNRIFNIEWRTVNHDTSTTNRFPINFEMRLYETTNVVEYVYGTLQGFTGHVNGESATVGLQKGTGAGGANDVTSFSCNAANLSNGLKVAFTPTTTCPQGSGSCGGLAPVSVGGRVTAAAGGRGISRALVTITGPGTNLTALTNIFGFYSVPALTPGQTYTVTCGRKGYTFTPQMITPNSSLTNVNFSGN